MTPQQLESALLGLGSRLAAEAASAERRIPEQAALARAGAVMARMIPDRLAAKIRDLVSDGALEKLPGGAGDAPGGPSPIALSVTKILRDFTETVGEEILAVTESALQRQAELRATAQTKYAIGSEISDLVTKSRASRVNEVTKEVTALDATELQPPVASQAPAETDATEVELV